MVPEPCWQRSWAMLLIACRTGHTPEDNSRRKRSAGEAAGEGDLATGVVSPVQSASPTLLLFCHAHPCLSNTAVLCCLPRGHLRHGSKAAANMYSRFLTVGEADSERRTCLFTATACTPTCTIHLLLACNMGTARRCQAPDLHGLGGSCCLMDCMSMANLSTASSTGPVHTWRLQAGMDSIQWLHLLCFCSIIAAQGVPMLTHCQVLTWVGVRQQ